MHDPASARSLAPPALVPIVILRMAERAHQKMYLRRDEQHAAQPCIPVHTTTRENTARTHSVCRLGKLTKTAHAGAKGKCLLAWVAVQMKRHRATPLYLQDKTETNSKRTKPLNPKIEKSLCVWQKAKSLQTVYFSPTQDWIENPNNQCLFKREIITQSTTSLGHKHHVR